MQRTLLLLAAAALSACVSTVRDEDRTKRQEAVGACRSSKFSSAVAKANCVNTAEMIGEARYPDLLNLRLKTRLALAEKQDRGLITQIEAEQEFAKTHSYIVGQEEARDTGRASVAAANRSISCYTVGGVTNCY